MSSMMDFSQPDVIVHSEFETSTRLNDVLWIPLSEKFITLGGTAQDTGIMEIYTLTTNNPIKLKQFLNPNSVQCGTFGATDYWRQHLVIGDNKGYVKLWDIEHQAHPLVEYMQHIKPVQAIDGIGGSVLDYGPPEIVTGALDGSVMVWDIRISMYPIASFYPKPFEAKRECWTVCFGNSFNASDRVVVSGHDNGDVKLYDLRTNTVRWQTNVGNGVCSVQFDRRDTPLNKLVVTTLESEIHLFDVSFQHPTIGYGHIAKRGNVKNSTIWFARHLPQNRDIFMTSSGDGSVNLWEYTYPSNRLSHDHQGDKYTVAGTLENLQNTVISTQPINALQWNTEKRGLAICTSYDQRIRALIVTRLSLHQ